MSATETINRDLLDYTKELSQTHKIAMLSNISRSGIDSRFEDGELTKYFDAVVVSGDIGFAKPEPQAYETAAERLGLRLDQCVMIDDKQEFCEAAQAVGMQAIHYQGLDRLKTELANKLN